MGQHVVDWEQSRVDHVVANIFGFNALQLGMPQCDFLRASRIPLKQKAESKGLVDIRCELAALPFATQSVDLVLLPHVLEFHPEPHQLLREIERVLIPEGQLIIHGFNPLSLWGIRRRLGFGHEDFPWNGQFFSTLRLKDWLSLLGFNIDRGCFGCYIPPCTHRSWLRHLRFMETAGDRWWGFAGGVYLLRAIKRVPGMRLIGPKWRTNTLAGRPLRPVREKEQTP